VLVVFGKSTDVARDSLLVAWLLEHAADKRGVLQAC